jgi:ADP-ribose pyrophosphatase YjhB (NUDIX family)
MINNTTKPKFKPKAGQTDYTNICWSPVLNCVLKCKDKILLVQRHRDSNFYPGYWNGISGFLDDQKTLIEKVIIEIHEETGLSEDKIKKIRVGEIFDQEEKKYKKIWIVHPVLVEVTTDQIKLDWEAENYQWLTLTAARKLKLLPGFDEVLKRLSV